MKFSWKNIENWRSWKMRFFWGGHFEFSKSAILNFFLFHLCEKSSSFIWGNNFFCTMDGFSRILEKKLFQLLCTRLYIVAVQSQEESNSETRLTALWCMGLKQVYKIFDMPLGFEMLGKMAGRLHVLIFKKVWKKTWFMSWYILISN